MLNQSLSGPRDRLLDAADELLNSAGIHTTGVDAIVRRSGTARKTFYRYFRSKEELIVTVLQRRSDRWIAWLERSSLARGTVALEQLLGMFDVLCTWLHEDGLHGCPVLNATAESRGKCKDIKQIAL